MVFADKDFFTNFHIVCTEVLWGCYFVGLDTDACEMVFSALCIYFPSSQNFTSEKK